MLKLFRKYNKWILAVGVCVLMVAFLIQPFLSSCTPTMSDFTLAEINGEEITWQDEREAAAQLQLMQSIPIVGERVRELVGDEGVWRWILMLHDARRLGLSASNAEVDDILALMEASRRIPDYRMNDYRLVIRNWLTVEQYHDLIYGRMYTRYETPEGASPLAVQNISSPGLRNLNQMYLARQMYAQGNYGKARELEMARMGSLRYSEPLIRHFLYERTARISGRFVMIDVESVIEQLPQPTQTELVDLYEQYKDDLPGDSAPYGFGYRFPDRVRIEYLTIPANRINDQVEVEEAEALDHYESNPDQYRDWSAATEDTTPPMRRYQDVRGQIIEQLTRDKADELGSRMISTAQAMLQEDTRGLSESDGYLDLPETFEMMSMQTVADRLMSQFGIEPDVTDKTEQWLDMEALETLPGIGSSRLANQRQFSFVAYVRSARELEPDDENELIHLRLQVGLPSMAMYSLDGSYYMFRLTAAEATRQPVNLDEVTDRVSEDARRLAGYQKLIDRKPDLVDLAVSSGLEELAEQQGVAVSELPPTARTTWGYRSEPRPPEVEGIGSSRRFIDALFAVVEGIENPAEVSSLSVEQRIGAAEIDGKLAVVVFEVEEYKPSTYKEYQNHLESSWTPIVMNMVLTHDMEESDDPLHWESITERVGYEAERRGGGDDDDDEEADDKADQTAKKADASN